MPSYVTAAIHNNVSLPSQFTVGAFDHFDHGASLSGIGVSPDTVMILMQNRLTDISSNKPNISDTNVIHKYRQYKKELECHRIMNYTKTTKSQVFSHINVI